MTPEHFKETETTVADKMRAALQLPAEHAEHFASQAMQNMVAEDKAIELTEDEERMLRAYRGFCRRNPSGGVFGWHKPPDDPFIVLLPPYEPSLILDPRDASKPTGGPQQ